MLCRAVKVGRLASVPIIHFVFNRRYIVVRFYLEFRQSLFCSSGKPWVAGFQCDSEIVNCDDCEPAFSCGFYSLNIAAVKAADKPT